MAEKIEETAFVSQMKMKMDTEMDMDMDMEMSKLDQNKKDSNESMMDEFQPKLTKLIGSSLKKGIDQKIIEVCLSSSFGLLAAERGMEPYLFDLFMDNLTESFKRWREEKWRACDDK